MSEQDRVLPDLRSADGETWIFFVMEPFFQNEILRGTVQTS